MSLLPLSINGAWVIEPKMHFDSRGRFHEVFKQIEIENNFGRKFEVLQVNQSVSAAGVIRGIHWADTPPGQAKYVSCSSGSIWDVVVDLRLGSATFGKWEAAVLSKENARSMFISEGLGHAFLALEDDTVVTYLCSQPYSPETERTINPLDETLAIDFSGIAPVGTQFEISDKDLGALSLKDMELSGKLPSLAGSLFSL